GVGGGSDLVFRIGETESFGPDDFLIVNQCDRECRQLLIGHLVRDELLEHLLDRCVLCFGRCLQSCGTEEKREQKTLFHHVCSADSNGFRARQTRYTGAPRNTITSPIAAGRGCATIVFRTSAAAATMNSSGVHG